MVAAELFVNIAVQGSQKAVGALKSVKDVLTDVSAEGLAAKAALLGAFYAFERFTSSAGKTGQELVNFNTLTGGSIKYLQQLREAFRQSGGDAKEADSFYKQVQQTMTKMQLEGVAPGGLATIFAEMGAPKNLNDTKEVIEKIMGYAQKFKNDPSKSGIVNEFVKQMGGNDSALLTARKFQGQIDQITKNVLTNGQVQKLQSVNMLWSDFFKKLEMANNSLTAQFAPKMIKDLTLVTDKVIALITAFANLADKVEAIKWIGLVFEGWGQIFEGMGLVVDKLTDKTPKSDAKKPLKERLIDGTEKLLGPLFYHESLSPNWRPPTPTGLLPKTGRRSENTTNFNTNVYQNGIEDSHGSVAALSDHLEYALRQSPAQGQVT